MTRGQLLREADSEELTGWMAYELIEPFGEQRADMRAAMIAATMVNVWRGKGQRPAKIEDFMPFREKRRQSSEDLLAWAVSANTALGGRDLRNKVQ